MTRTKNNQKLSHDQWLLIQKEQIKMITQLQEQNKTLKRKIENLEEELKKNQEVQEENEKMKKRVEELEGELFNRAEEVEEFLAQRKRKVLLTGDSHMKCISIEKLKSDTKTDVDFAKTYCSRLNYPGSKFPLVSISNVLQKKLTEKPPIL